MQAQASKSLTLAGSTKIVTDFFGTLYKYFVIFAACCIHNILFQRGLYPPESFKPVKQYGITLMLSQDEELRNYLTKVVSAIEHWIAAGELQKLVLVISSVDSPDPIERWVFDVQTNNNSAAMPTGLYVQMRF